MHHVIYDFRFYPGDEREYRGNGSNFDGRDASTLGERITINVDFRNDGPSQIISGQLNIYIPSFGSETGNYYYYYPAAVVIEREREREREREGGYQRI